MIKLTKETKSPLSLKITQSYEGEDVKKQLIEDQSGKCYICERILTTDFEVEHLKSKTHYPLLVQDWSNLFLSCRYCNGKKKEDYDDIVNPLKNEVENSIKQEIDFANKQVNFTNLTGTEDAAISKTIKLLNVIYNGSGKCRKIKEERFIEHIISVVNDFNLLVIDYLNAPGPNTKEAVAEDISIVNEALGFKYWIIKSHPQLDKTFANDIVWNK